MSMFMEAMQATAQTSQSLTKEGQSVYSRVHLCTYATRTSQASYAVTMPELDDVMQRARAYV